MNTREIAGKMPERLGAWLGESPLLAARLGSGRPWSDVLGDPAWAAEWAASAAPLPQALLRLIVRRFAGLPFEEEKLLQAASEEGGRTGAEARVALQRLRGDGVLFAVRKAWGDRLYYLPSDMVKVWQRLLLPLAAAPVDAETAIGIAPAADGFRLPLSQELLRAWSAIRRYGLPLTAKGTPHKAAVAKVAAAMGLEASALDALGLLPGAGDPTPLQAALALDLGLYAGVLRRGNSEILVDEEGAVRWLVGTAAAHEAKLAEMVASRYAGQDPALHFAATALAMAAPGAWYREDALAAGSAPGADAAVAAALARWLDALAAFGWVERGVLNGMPACRWTVDPDPDRAARREPPPAGLDRYEVLPDLEIVVPPETPPLARWRIAEVADLSSADVVSFYRLTRNACERASHRGHTADTVAALLEAGSGAPLPPPVRDAMDDWFRRLGRVEVLDAVVLRTDEPGLADLIAADPEATGMLGERIGERHYLVRGEARGRLEERLASLGYPPYRPQAQAAADLAESGANPGEPGAIPAARLAQPPQAVLDPGWTSRRPVLSFYELDPAPPAGFSELFPGLGEVPAAWLRQPRAYHASTRRELVERAVRWRTAIRVRPSTEDGGVDGWMTFVPQAVTGTGERWQVSGLVRESGFAESGPPPAEVRVTLPADGIGELMIVLPDEAR
ncbi:helicase-associated domain-containing protein [Cohnella sp. REN36]|uniref:helicase-associated domain-containing protein n=1 Tax=Cohnella sp. REN36 TaxID=2887347 RepID=UPI001D15CAC5|nr:helicase-associated domain-containing protein [Cohnella sp. REN36]MCC3372980.1 helicase-associated domain-containing protein [Cohnella sp. REN36]